MCLCCVSLSERCLPRQVTFTRALKQGSSAGAGRADAERGSLTGDLEQRAAVRELCLQRLTELCQQLAHAGNVPPATIMNVQALHDMAGRLPTDRAQMLQITHVTEANFAKYGDKLLEAIRPYAEQIAHMDEQSAAAVAAAAVSKEATAGRVPAGGKKAAPRRRRRGASAARAGGGTPPAKRSRTSQTWAAAAARNRALAVGRGRGRGRGAATAARPATTGLGLMAPPQPRSFLNTAQFSRL